MTKSSTGDDGNPIRVAIVGYGLAGSVFHAPLIACTQGLELRAVVTRDPARKASAQQEFPHCKVLSNADDVFKNADQFDLLVVASPNDSHAPLAMAGMQAGLHVVIDKPMAVSSAQCEELIRTSRETGRLLSVFQNRRWDADFLTVSLLIRSNALGTINRYESRFERWRPKPKPGSWRERGGTDEGAGLLFDLGSHLIDQALLLFGKPKTVYAEIDIRRAEVRADDDAFVALSFENGVHAHLWTSAVVRKAAPRFRICGMSGTFEKYGLDPQEDALRAGRRPVSDNWGSEPMDLWGTLFTERDGLRYEGKIETLRGDYLHFYQAMAAAVRGEGAVPVEPTDGLLTLKIIEAARKSAQTGCLVNVD